MKGKVTKAQTDEAFSKTLDNIWPEFEKWYYSKGYLSLDMKLSELKFWYEYLNG